MQGSNYIGSKEDNKRVAIKCDVPRVGSIIVINERKIKRGKPFVDDVKTHSYRGCVIVESETRYLITCREFYSENVYHTVSFRKADFLCGLLRYIVVSEPLYKEHYSWREYDIDNVEQTIQVAI